MKRKRKNNSEDTNNNCDSSDSDVSLTDNTEENNGFIEYKLRTIMYVRGDVKEPRRDSVATMQSILRREMNNLLAEAEGVASIQKSQVISHEHILYLLRKHKMKLKRMLEHLEFMDKAQSYKAVENLHYDPSVPLKNGKRLRKCVEFLQELGGFREFISTLYDRCAMDPTTRMRLERRNLLVKYMSAAEYFVFSEESSRATFCPRKQIWTFKEWLLQDRTTFCNITPLAVTMIEFLALETISVVIDTAIHIQTKKLGIGHIFSHRAKIEFKVPRAIIKPITRKDVSGLSSARNLSTGNQDVHMKSIPENNFIKVNEETIKSSCLSKSDKNIPSKHSATSRRNSIGSNDADHLCTNSEKLQLNTPVKNTSVEAMNEVPNLIFKNLSESDSNTSSESVYLVLDEASNLSSVSNSSTCNHNLNGSVERTGKSRPLDAQEQKYLYRNFCSKMSGESSSNFLIPRNFNLISGVKKDTKLASSADNNVKECNLQSGSETFPLLSFKAVSGSSQNSVQKMDLGGSMTNHDLNHSSKKAVLSSYHNSKDYSYTRFLSEMSGKNASNFLALPKSNPVSELKKNTKSLHFTDNSDGSMSSHDLNSTKMDDESCSSLDEQDNSYRWFFSKMSNDSSSNFLAPPNSNTVGELKESTKPSFFTDNDFKKCHTSCKNDAKISPKCNSGKETQNLTPPSITPEEASSHLSTDKNLKKKIALKIDGKIYLVSESDMQLPYLQKYQNGSQNSLSTLINVEGTTHSLPTSGIVTEVKKNSKSASSTNKDIKECKTSLKRDAGTSIECDSVNEIFSSKSESVLEGHINSSGTFLSAPDSVKETSEIPITISPVTEVRKDSKPGSTNKDVEICRTSLKDAEISLMSDTSSESSCEGENVNSSHNSFSSSICPEGTSKILAVTKPSVVSGVKNNNGYFPSTEKKIKKISGSLREETVISRMSDSDVELPSPQEKNSSHNPLSSSISPAEISITTKPSIVSEVNNSKSAPSTSKKDGKYTGSLKKDAVLCPMCDSDAELPCPQEKATSAQNSCPPSNNCPQEKATSAQNSCLPSNNCPQEKANSAQNSCPPSNNCPQEKATSAQNSCPPSNNCPQEKAISTQNSCPPSNNCPQEKANSAQNSCPHSNNTTKKTEQLKKFSENLSAYASQQKILFQRVPLTPEEITEAYLELQETPLIYTWFTPEENFYKYSRLICLADSPAVDIVKSYMDVYEI